MKVITLLFLSLFIANSCNDTKKMESSTFTYYVNSSKVDCEGVAKMKCLQVQKGDVLDAANWNYFYSTIEDFTYEPGYIYKLKVKETILNPSTVPADASSVKYTLVEILEKTPDATLQLHDIWALEAMNGMAVTEDNFSNFSKQPILELFIADKRIVGNDGCNSFFGSIESLDTAQIRFGKMGSTKMACPNMELSNTFTKALQNTTTYTRDGLTLSLFDASETEVLRFKKVD